MIKLKNCFHGWLYRIHSRNLALGVFDKKKGGFIGIREKFGSRYLFMEYHYDTGAPFGTVTPLERLVKLPNEIHLGIEIDPPSICASCGVGVKYANGFWFHLEESPNCKKLTAYSNTNDALFNWLDEKEKQLNDG